MASQIPDIAMCILFVLAMMQSSAAARELSASPMAAPNATAITVTTSGGQGILLLWLQVTAVPLGVFLLGACTWGVIENSAPWRSLTGHREHHSSNAADQGDDLRPAYELPALDDSSRTGSDLEEGNVSSYRSEANDPADSAPGPLLTTPLPAIQSPNDGRDAATDAAAPRQFHAS